MIAPQGFSPDDAAGKRPPGGADFGRVAFP
jgi:hypothetical protein